ncbi:hypothetical protein CLI64_12715 [Nostoc sp. CENA543]|uniref:hypothetical protein n=1 Tax=Nostoc sp. CENA543 TaxID=1869241 RepID=UPI000CA1692B|nr:hypothetical protein [Nostoc sp. CENA543]AUT01196.1 hypothetical protein CLI64_12715 [Nostoc sp. CENA543]
MPSTPANWTTQIYNYAEHLYDQPWELEKSDKITNDQEIFQRLRHREVPLNLIFNIFLDVISKRIKYKIINLFFNSQVIDNNSEYSIDFIDKKILIEKLDKFQFIQTDVVLESMTSRCFIELKIKSTPLSLQKIHKYLFLHGLWRHKTKIHKTPYLLLLTEKPLDKQWAVQERSLVFTTSNFSNDLYQYMIAHDLPDKFGKDGSMTYLHDEVIQVMTELQLGWTTWQSLGEMLKQELESLNHSSLQEGEEVLKRLLDGFLNELSQRQLWQEK